MGRLTQAAEAAVDMLDVATIDAVADKGYFRVEDIAACQKAGIAGFATRLVFRRSG